MECSDCKGSGSIDLFSSTVQCDPCDGTGVLPTEAKEPLFRSINEILASDKVSEEKKEPIRKMREAVFEKARDLVVQVMSEYPNATDDFIEEEVGRRLQEVPDEEFTRHLDA